MPEATLSSATDGVRAIQELAEAAIAIREIDSTPFVLLPSGYKAESLERLKDEPTRHRAIFCANDLESFMAYLDLYADHESIVAIGSTGTAKAILDYGTKLAPSWGSHKATFMPQYSPEMAALRTFCDRPNSQKQVVEYLEDWGEIVTPLVEGEAVSIVAAIAAFRRVNISTRSENTREERATGVSRSAMEQVEAKSSGGELPTRMLVNCALWDGFEPVSLEVAVSLRTTGDKPEFSARIVALPAVKKTHFEQVSERIMSAQGIRAVLGERSITQ